MALKAEIVGPSVWGRREKDDVAFACSSDSFSQIPMATLIHPLMELKPAQPPQLSPPYPSPLELANP